MLSVIVELYKARLLVLINALTTTTLCDFFSQKILSHNLALVLIGNQGSIIWQASSVNLTTKW